MKKKDLILREILNQALEEKGKEFTQKELASKFKVSLSTVFNALKGPRKIGAIKVTGRNFSVINLEKLLYFWGTIRDLSKDVIYETHVDGSAPEIESLMPPGVIFTAYSAYVRHFKIPPADYDKVYIYFDNLKEIKRRFPKRKGYINLIVLKPDPYLKKYGSIAPLSQMFADLWNLSDWYAKEFIEDLKEKI